LQQHHSLRPRVKIDQANRDTKAHESLESTAANKQRMASSNTHDQLMRSEKPKVAVLAKRPVVQSTRHEVAEPSEVALEQVPDAVAPARESTKRVAAASLTSRPASWGLAIAAVIAVTALVASGLVAWVMSTRTAEVDVNQAMVAKIVAGHLAAAQRAFELGSYVDPPGLSAIHFYNAVLELDPVNEPAKSGLNAVADRLLADSKQLIASGDLLYAQSTLDNLRRIEPNHPELPDVTAALLSARQAERLTIQAAYATTVPSTAAVAVATAPTGAAKRPIAVNKDDNKIRAQGPVSSSSLADNGSNTRVVDDATLSTRDKPTDQELFAANLMNTSEGKFVGPVLDAAELRAPAIAAALQEAGIPARIPEDAIASTSSLAPSDQTTSALSKPKLIKYVPPEYPDKARAANLEGWLDVNFLVTSDGSVVSPRIVSGTLGNKFHRPALAAVTQWKFLPANGAANRPMNVRLEFKLAK
jgi:protein TonB